MNEEEREEQLAEQHEAQLEAQLWQRSPESIRAEIRRTRHRKEVPLYILVSILGLIGSYLAFMSFAKDNSILEELREIFSSGELANETLGFSQFVLLFLFILGMVSGVGALLLLVIVYLVGVYKIYGDQLSYSVRVSETNFPEIYAKVQEYTRLLGLKKEPEVYIQQMNGTLNAFTAWVPGKIFLQLNAELVDIAYLEHKDLDTVSFVMAHEFGHAYLHHVQMYYNLWPVLVNFIPVLGSAILRPLLSRAREYSADRVAQALTGGVSQTDCMMFLATGRHLYKYVSVEDYLEHIRRPLGVFPRLARWCINLLASHPITPFRTAAILDPEKRSGRLL